MTPATDARHRREHARTDLSSYEPAYGQAVAGLLSRVACLVENTTEKFVGHFYAVLNHRRTTAAILNRLTREEHEHLQRRQARHLRMVMCAELTAAAHFAEAQRVGHVHEMVGVELPSLLEAYHLCQSEIRNMLQASELAAPEQEQLLGALNLRLMLDMEAQITSHYRTDQQTAEFMANFEDTANDATNLTDLLQGAVQLIPTVDGLAACLFLRPDAQSILQIEAAGGELGRAYARQMQHGDIPHISIDPGQPAGQGPTGLAWRNADVQVYEWYRAEESLNPWQAACVGLGLRSSATVPLLDEAGQPFALLSLYSQWAGFFDNPVRRSTFRHLQQVLSHAVLRCERGRVIPVQLRREYRKRLEQGAVELHYQPIVNLGSGQLEHFEALARLRSEGGRLLSPGAFLPAFGEADQLRLFQLVLRQVCRDGRLWQQGPGSAISINLPAQALSEDGYRDILFEILETGAIAASCLRLEILESYDPVDQAKRDTRLGEFKQAGFAIVQDDLGSGHSSLLRMDRMDFNEVKIDQGLVRSAMDTPQRALEFIYHLTRLAHGFGIPVTVEGLENRGLIEAATILGADHGQGFGIARPMPAHEVPAWRRGFRHEIDPQQPTTPLGALAGYLLWDQQLAALSRWPDLIEDFVRSPCLVQRYIAGQNLGDSPLQALLDSNHACALRGKDSAMYAHTKQELIRQLGGAWQREQPGSA